MTKAGAASFENITSTNSDHMIDAESEIRGHYTRMIHFID